jgi:type I restriction enzyme, S subunit
LFVSLCLIKPLNKIYINYLELLFKGGFFDQQMTDGSKATTVTNLHLEVIRELKLVVPSISEQKVIAQYLDQATEQIDKAIEIKTKQLEKLETYKKNKIHEVVTKGIEPNPKLKPSNISWIGEIPEHWKVERLKFVLTKIGSGVTPKGGSTVYQETGIPFIRSQNVYNDGFYFDEIAFISEKIHEEMKGSKVLFGDVLLNITGASIGRCFPYLSTDEANVNQHVCILRPNEKIITEFLHYLMISEIGQNQITSGFKGSGREGLNFETIKNFAITLPKKNEQKTIATYLDNFCKNIENAKENIEKQLTQLKKYRKSLIHECVTGKRKIA